MARRRSWRSSVSIEVDIAEVLSDLSDDEIAEALTDRNIAGVVNFAELERAYDWLRKGDTAEALLILERLVRPKWHSLAAAEEALAKARHRQA